MYESGRRQRFCRLLEPHHAELRAFARRLCRSESDGDDLFQEAAMRALVKLDGLRSDDAFRFWFYRVLLSVHRNRTRRSFWSRLIPIADGDEGSEHQPDLGAAERVRAALAALPPEQREAIVMFELQGMTVDEVAELQGASASAVKSRLARGRGRLRSIYRKRFGVGDTSPAIAGET